MLPHLLALLGLAAGSPPEAVSVLVRPDGISVTVTVTAPTSQREVLSALCARFEAQCDLAGLPEKAVVGPGAFAGAWDEVVARLLEGSSTGYAAVPPAPGRKAQLLVARGVPTAASNTPSPSGPGGIVPADLPSTMEPEDVGTEAPTPDPTETGTDPSGETDQGGDDASTAGGSAGQRPSVSVAVAPPAAPAGFVMTPFADPGGKPLLVPAAEPPVPGFAATPFSTEAGEPLSVPQTGEAPTLTPFSGPDGEPIPVVPAPLGPKLEYPIPPTASPAKEP